MFIISKLTTTFLRHLLPIGVTTLVLFLIQLFFLFLFLIGLAFGGDGSTGEDTLTFTFMDYLHWIGLPLLISILISAIVFPPAVLLEWIASKLKILIIAIPVGLVLASAGGIVLHDLWIKSERPFQLLDTFVDLMAALSFIALAYSIPFTFYWSILWFGRAIVHSLRLGIKILFSAIIEIKSRLDLATHSSV